jgi:adenylate cyclase
MKKNAVSLIISTSVCLCVLLLWWFGALESLENKVVDTHFKLRGVVQPYQSIALVSIDENSINKLGRWPWPRSTHAKLIDKLTAAGAKAIVFDVLFTEPDKDRPLADEELGKAAKRSGRVVFSSFFQAGRDGSIGKLFLPIEPLRKNALTGFTNTFPETDGVNRKVPLTKDFEGETVPSLSIMGLSVFLGKTPLDIIKEKKIVIDDYNEMFVNFAGGYETFPYYSFASVLNDEVDPAKFKDKIVLVGGTATALFDLKAVPFSPIFPGFEIHANAISSMILGNFLRPWPGIVTFIFIVLFAFLSGKLLGNITPWKGGVSVVSVFVGYFVLTHYLFTSRFIVGEFVAPALSLSLGYVGILFYRFMSEEKEKRQIKKNFSHYFSPKVMEKILSDPSHLKLGGQKRSMTVLFSDIRSFTTISESLDSEQLIALLNEYLTTMVEVVFKFEGTLDKFIGDAVMAFWGAPMPQEDHASRAVLCAIEMHEELEKLKAKWRAEGKRVFNIGIGVNTGEMTVGNMGSKQKMEYTVIGDSVNLGSRLESLNKEYKTRMIISESTYEVVKDIVEAEPLGTVKVKGKHKAVNIYAVYGKKGERKFVGLPEEEYAKKSKEDEGHKNEMHDPGFDPDARIQIDKNN